ncbi:hypothetical protein KQX54_008093 [Cotesia glomerata]|uniref:SWIM-type domain-containing protein n=1 Tax=Cotesia glomerata TaxID=32391 RepID=A0AAV7HST8_COTGL|nr:hypothetical protein KQX54_008093 [Cotesia glomerata]
MHKLRSLIKPMVCVAPNGYIIDIFRPFPATQNDVSILLAIRKNMPQVKCKFKPGDVFVVDKGFRDAVNYLQDKGFIAKLPDSIPAGESQLTDLNANHSRIVTKIRYVVETINGHLKTCFKYFDNLMKSKLNQKNTLGQIVKECNLNRKRSRFHNINENDLQVQDFPILTEQDLYLIALGRYQLNQAKCYYGEHISTDGKLTIELCTDITHIDFTSYELHITDPLFLKARIQLRHINKTKYYIYILDDKNVEGRDSIKAYYCTCKNGVRTVGCCIHIRTVIWYLGYAKHQKQLPKPPSEQI